MAKTKHKFSLLPFELKYSLFSLLINLIFLFVSTFIISILYFLELIFFFNIQILIIYKSY